MIKGQADALARFIAAFGMSPADPTEGGAGRAVPDADAAALTGQLAIERLTGLATAAMDAGRLVIGEVHKRRILDHHERAMMQALALERQLLAVASAFEERGLEMVVLKGPVLANLVYPDPSWRPFGDLDVLVRTKDWREACQQLSEFGFVRRLPEPRLGFDERFGKAAVHRRSDGLEVDLHRSLVLGPFGFWIRSEELFDRTQEFRLAGRSLKRLDDAALFLHACVHALGWRPSLLLTLRDVAETAHLGQLDWAEAVELARRWRIGPVVRHALETSAASLRVRLPDQVGAFLEATPSKWERRVLSAYTGTRRAKGGIALLTIRALPDLRSKMAYVRALVYPSRDFLDARAGGRQGSYLARWRIPAAWLRRGEPAKRRPHAPNRKERRVGVRRDQLGRQEMGGKLW
ncbi:MAG: nucleotidyltransferase family protein [Actinomycetota bacterium]